MSHSDDDKKSDYTVGYGKPPSRTRFKPGQSGNRKGRPKGVENYSTLLESEMNALISYIAEDGKRKKISKIRASIRQAINKAASGDLRALHIFLKEIRLYEEKSKSSKADTASPVDRPLIPPRTIEEAASIYRAALKNARSSED